MKIDEYSFGHIVIDGNSYNEDVIIFDDKVKANWHRREGHELCLDDMKDILKKKPKLLIVGTGHGGCLKVLEEVIDYCKKNDIQLISQLTGDAVNTYNDMKGRGVVAALHLTC